jgi:membrane protein required for colicin V production
VGDYLITKLPVIDILILVLVAWGAVKGFQRGFLAQIVSLFVFVMSIVWLSFGVLKLFDLGKTQSQMEPSKAVAFVFFLAILLVIWIAISKIDQSIAKVFAKIRIFESFDGIVGLVIGAYKYCLTLSIFLELMVMSNILGRTALLDSYTYPLLYQMFITSVDVATRLSPSIAETMQNMKYLLQ